MTTPIQHSIPGTPIQSTHEDVAHDAATPSAANVVGKEIPRPSTPAVLSGLPARQAPARGGVVDTDKNTPANSARDRATLARLSTRTGIKTSGAVAGKSNIVRRLAEMKGYLMDLQAAYAKKIDLPKCRDEEFLDLLVAAENARDPALRLSVHAVDHDRLRRGDDPSAVGDLARRLVSGMHLPQQWHAIVSMDEHTVALSVRHDPESPEHVSLIVVDSSGGSSSRDWTIVASSLVDHLNEATYAADNRGKDRKPRTPKVYINCLNTSIQRATDGSAIFAIAIAREMHGDGDIGRLHQEALAGIASLPKEFAVRATDGDALLGARFFKHMTLEASMRRVLTARPTLEKEPVNKKAQTLRERQATYLHTPPLLYGFPYQYSDSYKKKRLKIYEQAIRFIESVAAPEPHAARPQDRKLAERVEAMSDYLHELIRARKGKCARPTPRDAEFLDLLAEAESEADPQLRLSTHKVDSTKLAERDGNAIASLSSVLAEGVRSGNDWRATLDFEGRHIALAAHHDKESTAHVSIAIFDGIGVPLQDEPMQNLSIVLGEHLQNILRNVGNTQTAKVRLTRVSVALAGSAVEPAANSALLALLASINMKNHPHIEKLHEEALTEVRSSLGPITIRDRDGSVLLDSDDRAKSDSSIADTLPGDELLFDQIEMYRAATGHFALFLAPESAPD